MLQKEQFENRNITLRVTQYEATKLEEHKCNLHSLNN